MTVSPTARPHALLIRPAAAAAAARGRPAAAGRGVAAGHAPGAADLLEVLEEFPPRPEVRACCVPLALACPPSHTPPAPGCSCSVPRLHRQRAHRPSFRRRCIKGALNMFCQ